MRIDPSTATRAVQSLVTDGLAERLPSPEDGRVVMVRVSAEGRARHADVAARRNLALKQILDSFDPAERATLADLLDRFVDALDGVVTSLTSDDEDSAGKDRPAE
jgi:DNA-binding MarR family transcriptional regulator